MTSSEGEKILLDAVLVFPVRDGNVTLPRKMKKIGKGKRNGYGGGIEPGELPIDAAIRKVTEESGIIPSREHLSKVAEMVFHNLTEDGREFDCRVHVYFLVTWPGVFIASDEMADPREFPADALPLDELMLADRVWLPPVFAGKKIVGEAWYGPRQETLRAPVGIEEVMFFQAT